MCSPPRDSCFLALAGGHRLLRAVPPVGRHNQDRAAVPELRFKDPGELLLNQGFELSSRRRRRRSSPLRRRRSSNLPAAGCLLELRAMQAHNDGVLVMIAKYNPQVHALNRGLGELTRGGQGAASFSFSVGPFLVEEISQPSSSPIQARSCATCSKNFLPSPFFPSSLLPCFPSSLLGSTPTTESERNLESRSTTYPFLNPT